MDALEKLAEKNRIHSRHLNAEKLAAIILLVGLLPFYIDLAFTFFKTNLAFPDRMLYAALSLCGVFGFVAPLLALGQQMLLPTWLKYILFVLLHSWFTYFWVFHNSSWVAFLPLIPVYIVYLVQVPYIRAKIGRAGDGL